MSIPRNLSKLAVGTDSSGILGIDKGGTGGTTTLQALTNLGAYPASNPNNYITSTTAASTYQILDADLTAIAGLSGTSGLLKKTAANTWSLDTSAYLTSSDLGSYLTSSTAASTYAPLTGTGASGTWSISISGNAATATTATTATTANATNTANNYQVNSLGVGTAGSGTTGEIRATNNVSAYYSSDQKFKENIRNIPNAAATATAIGGKLFDWTDTYIAEHGGIDNYFLRKEDFGIIAQDAQKYFPIAVRTRPDGSLAVDYEKLSALALAAIAELTKRVELLETK